jgi:hypothetical protein
MNAPKGSVEENHRAMRNLNLFNMTLRCKNRLSSTEADFKLLAEAVEKTRMPKAKSVLVAASVAVISTGLTVVGVGAFFLKRLDDRAFGNPGVFYAAVRHYASVTSAGIPVCLAGCIALAIVLDYKQGFRAGVTSIFIAFAFAVFGLFLFPIHFPSGAVYFSLLGVTFGASLVFFSVASIRYLSDRIRSAHGKR